MSNGSVPAYAAVIGDPVAHSLSPAIHNAAFAALGIDAHFEAVTVAPHEAGGAVELMRSQRWLGMSVTMPHKAAVMPHLDALTPSAERLGAVNCVFWDGDRLTGDNTDGAGVVWAMTEHLGRAHVGRRVVVLGAGGAARACIAAVAEAGATEVVVLNRTAERAEAAAALVPGIARVGNLDDLADADVVINATPVGLVGGADPNASPTTFVPGAGALAMDLIYHPLETTWLARCRANGAITLNGVPMLVGQAAVAFERWTGRTAPVDAMLTAVGEALRPGS